MRVRIEPSRAFGTVMAPPSKSMAHRLLICAGLSDGESVVRRLSLSRDITATIGCLRALGAKITLTGDTAVVRGTDVLHRQENAVLRCDECGSTLRFFIPLCMLSQGRATLTGTPYLMSRPLSVYEEIARARSLYYDKGADAVTVGGALAAGVYRIPANISSQFVSGLLFALPMLPDDSEIVLIPPVESRPYIDMTVSSLNAFGVAVSSDGDTYRIAGGQRYAACSVTVEGDCSNAAFFEALNAAGGAVEVAGLSPDTLQGDRVYKRLFERIRTSHEVIDISDCPDLGPVLFAVAALQGGGMFSGTARLRFKESDRAAAMRAELNKFGADTQVGENTVTVRAGDLHAPNELLDGHGDHRIVMALSVLAARFGGVIDGAEQVEKSFPDFFDRLRELHVEVSEDGMDQ